MWFSKKSNESGCCVCCHQLPVTILVFCLALTIPRYSWSGDTESQKPILLMLFLDAPGFSEIEKALQNELALNIDTHQVVVEKGFQFTKTTIPDRIDELRRLAKAQCSDAVIWISPRDNRTVSLQMAVLAPGQFTIRSVEADIDAGEVGELTIAVRELLADIQISMPVPVATSKETPNEEKPAEFPGRQALQSRPASHGANYFIFLDGGVESDFKRSEVSPAFLFGTLGFGMLHPSGFLLSTAVAVPGALPMKANDTVLKTWGFRPELQLGYLWQSNGFRMGLFSGARIQYQVARISFGVASDRKVAWWTPGFNSGLLLLLRVGASIQILVRSAIGINVSQIVLKRKSDESTVYETPRLTGSVAAGVVVAF